MKNISIYLIILIYVIKREFLRAGSDVMQAFTFYASEDKLINRGNKAGESIGVKAINRLGNCLYYQSIYPELIKYNIDSVC